MYKIFIQGIVQGVGFRPYIYRKAKEQKLVGSVKNTGNGVEILVNDKDFIQKLTDLPPLARISNYTIQEYKSKKTFYDFSILKSAYSEGETELPPDIFLCADCLRELKNKNNRRYNYYFITCTNCGPRFTMIEDYPYDRPFTSMHQFKMCSECSREYTNPLDRRYHAQTIACKNCGPKLRLICDTKDVSGLSDIETIQKAVALIKSGEILSVKGVGGFHTCSLCNDLSVLKIRKMFNRLHKPYAVMVKNVQMAKAIAKVSSIEKKFLESPQRPIVVLPKRKLNTFNVISELDTIGVMLPYTALHYLLFDYINEPLVMTSCNFSGEPISTIEKLGRYFLTHERNIVNRCDDSVVKIIHTTPYYLRRSRGFTPLPVTLPIQCKDTIAVGAELNNVICTAKKNKCYLSQYIGDTSSYETYNFLKETIEKLIHLSRVKPQIVTCDLHPQYNSTILASEVARKYKASLIPIQHHKAHVASVAAERHITDYIGIAMDGLGYGDDGQLWGGEIFSVSGGNIFTRIGHLEEQPQLGGDSAALYPKKMLFGILSKMLSEEEMINLRLFTKKDSLIYLKLLNNRRNIPLTTSTGRILDAASALLGLCEERTYDGRPAMLLESSATTPLEFEPIFSKEQGRKILMTTPLFEFLLKNKKDRGRLAATTQMYIAKGLFLIAKNASKKKGLPIVFSGGVAYNRMISGYMLSHGVLGHKELPAGDGCICYGQTYLANLSDCE
ncbi:MAG: carbamoyltransferase HypF [Candidatus Thermoplasmatota archaeon]|nr:carbamoyltransferase HypF [Candidatus Thermoplasmatota archaeon]